MKAAVANQLATQSGTRDGSRLGAIGSSDHLRPVSPGPRPHVPPGHFSVVVSGVRNAKKIPCSNISPP